MRWAELTIECHPQAADAVSYAFIQAGCGGVMLEGVGTVAIKGSLPADDELDFRISNLQSHLDEFEEFGLPPLNSRISLKYIDDEDWATTWKKYFKPLHIGQRLVVKPSWELYDPASHEIVLELDPGMAFGTGGHPTTRLCMEALEERICDGYRVADIGTGSGILSIAASKLGASEVYATDIDGLPRRIAAANVARNELSESVRVLAIDEFDIQARDCDLVVANIVANTIVELASTIAERIVDGGVFIGSGIVDEHHDLVRDALQSVGLEHVETKREDIWVCLVSKKSAQASRNGDALQRASELLPPIGGVGILN